MLTVSNTSFTVSTIPCIPDNEVTDYILQLAWHSS